MLLALVQNDNAHSMTDSTESRRTPKEASPGDDDGSMSSCGDCAVGRESAVDVTWHEISKMAAALAAPALLAETRTPRLPCVSVCWCRAWALDTRRE